MDRTILHCDCNGFYAAVECVFHPELKDVPMAVCGDPKSRHGVILAKNELAKKYHIQTAETVWQAKEKCPDLVLVRPHHKEYQAFSKQVNAIYCRFTDQVEPFGIDESWLDVTGSRLLFGDGKTIADTLRKLVKEETGLTISVGVSFNKVFAKLGSDYKKPDATTVIMRKDVEKIVHPLPVEALLFVGKAAKRSLRDLGIYTIGDLARFPKEPLVRRLGKLGEQLSCYAKGEDESPVALYDREKEVKSVGNGMTFSRNLTSLGDCETGLLPLCDEVASRLRKYGLSGKTVTVAMKTANLKTVSRQKTLDAPTDLAREIFLYSLRLLSEIWDGTTPIRALTVTVSGFEEENFGEQLSLLPKEDLPLDKKRQKELESAVDRIRNRFGDEAISYAKLINNDLGIK